MTVSAESATAKLDNQISRFLFSPNLIGTKRNTWTRICFSTAFEKVVEKDWSFGDAISRDSTLRAKKDVEYLPISAACTP